MLTPCLAGTPGSFPSPGAQAAALAAQLQRAQQGAPAQHQQQPRQLTVEERREVARAAVAEVGGMLGTLSALPQPLPLVSVGGSPTLDAASDPVA